jgi:putative SOS response-associated peptidase YedK
MCGRFVGYRKLEELYQHFTIDHVKCESFENYNIAPAQKILVIAQQEGKNILDRFHWGLVPNWAKDKTIGTKLINARSETLSTKASFRNAFKRRRCLIPADGFYEWKTIKGIKQPYYFTLSNDKPFAFAGLWEIWTGENEAEFRSCTIVTTDATESVKLVHHRMPVILKLDYYDQWLDAKNLNVSGIQKILHDGIVTELSSWPVSSQVNSVKNNGPENIERILLT